MACLVHEIVGNNSGLFYIHIVLPLCTFRLQSESRSQRSRHRPDLSKYIHDANNLDRP